MHIIRPPPTLWAKPPAIDLPGHGATPPLAGETTIATLADAVTEFVNGNNLNGVDVVGSLMGARLVLELARRGGMVGGGFSLDPGGFWQGWQIPYCYHSINLSIKLVRLLQPVMPALTGNVISRSMLFAQFSARPWRIAPRLRLTRYARSPRRPCEKFPDAQLYWFDHCGHFPQWDKPRETVRLILEGMSQEKIAKTIRATEKDMGARAGRLRYQQ
jgi:pimeloyl-ACP methyl ester carboxylesterase